MHLFRCLQNYIPPQSLTLSCPVCRQTSILPEKGVAALQNNFFITNLMEVLQRDPECSRPEACNVLESASAATACQPLSCPNHEGKVSYNRWTILEDIRSQIYTCKLLKDHALHPFEFKC